jgi:hypothetical protein
VLICSYVGKGQSPSGAPTPRGVAHRERGSTVDERSVVYGDAREQDYPHACWDGYIYLGYTDEAGEEQIEKLPCRRCAEGL